MGLSIDCRPQPVPARGSSPRAAWAALPRGSRRRNRAGREWRTAKFGAGEARVSSPRDSALRKKRFRPSIACRERICQAPRRVASTRRSGRGMSRYSRLAQNEPQRHRLRLLLAQVAVQPDRDAVRTLFVEPGEAVHARGTAPTGEGRQEVSRASAACWLSPMRRRSRASNTRSRCSTSDPRSGGWGP